jgi:glycosyltransferase involved in cell wall biosynthesis
VTPFISIVIPTRNRPHYLPSAIASVLLQDFDDFECIVSDNCSEASTQRAISTFRANSRLRYYRTDRELNMMDHWEFATRKATGEYVILLADRKVLLRGALRRLCAALERYPEIPAFSLGLRIYDDSNHRMGWCPLRHPTGLYSTSVLVRDFLTQNIFGPGTLDGVYPKTLNGGYHRGLAERARSVTGRYFNNDGVTTPDYSSFFVNCALSEEILHLNDPLLLAQGEAESNGRRFGAGDTGSYMGLLRREDPYEEVPLEAPFIYNLLTVDFLAIRRLFQGNLASFDVSWSDYFRTLYAEYRIKEQSGFLTKQALDSLRASWREACERVLGPGAADRTAERCLTEEAAGSRPAPLLDHLRDFLNHRFSHWSLVNRLTGYRFPSALEAAGFRPEHLRALLIDSNDREGIAAGRG